MTKNIWLNKLDIFQILMVLQMLFSVIVGQLTFPTSSINIPDSGMTLYFEFFDQNNTVQMGLEIGTDVDYFAIGFSNEDNFGMKNFDIVAFIFVPSGSDSFSVNVLDLYSTAYSRPPTDISRGGTADYRLLDFFVGNGKRQVLFERAYDTGDINDYTFQPDLNETKIALSWAWLKNGQAQLSYHGSTNRGTIITPFYNGFQGEGTIDEPSGVNPDVIIKLHSCMMFLAWGILIDIALWSGRYKKSSKNGAAAHLWIALLVYVITVVMITLVLSLGYTGDGGIANLAHYYIGCSVLGITSMQIIIGFIFRYKLLSYKVTKMIAPLSKFHKRLGISLYLVTKGQLMIGVYIYKQQFAWILVAWYGFLLSCWLIQECLYRYGLKLKKQETEIEIPLMKGSKIERNRKLMDLLNKNTPVSEILEAPGIKGMKWAILDNKVFEIKDFTHPGGNFILKHIQGREVGRFIYGVLGLEIFTGDSQHLHSNNAEILIQRNIIGTINSGYQILVSLDLTGTSHQALHLDNTSSNWSLAKKTELSTYIAKFEFECSGFEINPWVKDIRHIGRHMKIKHVSNSKTRLYTLVLSQTECRTKRRNLLWSKSPKDAKLAADLMNTNSKTLPLILKKYESPKAKTFSSFLHKCKLFTDKFTIEGPYGTGLDLTPKSTGLHYIFAAGTGILPFLDLFDYLLENVLLANSTLNIFKNGFKLHIFASFGQLNDFVGRDICEKLIQACRDSEMKDAVKMTIRSKEAKENGLFTITKEAFDSEFIRKHVDSNSEKAYLCGPPLFNQQLSLALETIGLSKGRIIFV